MSHAEIRARIAAEQANAIASHDRQVIRDTAAHQAEALPWQA